MDDKEIGDSYLIVSETKINSFYPMYFGVSCAFFALEVVSKSDQEGEKRFELCDKMLQGSAQLLGLLVWRIQRGVENSELLRKLEVSEKEIKELKEIRREDAKANEKVVSIFASQEQIWFSERKKLRQEIGALMNELRVHQTQKEAAISELNDKIKAMETLVESKDMVIEEEGCKRKFLEEKLSNAQNVAEELRQNARREAQEYSSDLWKHKTAFLELVSNQRQLEAELGRALRQLEVKRQEIEESVLLAQKLSIENVKMGNDLEQKDKILSAMLRKCKLDTAEKQMLLKEVKLSKAKKKQAEVETEKWRAVSESKHQRNSLRNMFARQNSRADHDPSIARGSSQIVKTRSPQAPDYVLEYENPEFRNDAEALTPILGYYSPEINGELAITADVKRIEAWVRAEAEKYSETIERRHHSEIDAFAEQMRLKDEKLEAFRWRMLSLEIESKRLLSRVEGLNKDMSKLRNENMNLETLLFHSQEAFNALKQQLTMQVRAQICQADSYALIDDDVSIDKTVDTEIAAKDEDKKEQLSQEDEEDPAKEDAEFEEDKKIPSSTNETCSSRANVDTLDKSSTSPTSVGTVDKLPLPSEPSIKTSNLLWRMDLQALGVSYKIKRLKQQLLMLERLTGKQESAELITESNGGSKEIKGFDFFICLLNKQISRYQSLQSKIDELCNRMHDNEPDKSRGDSRTLRTKGETKTLEHFLEETFQLQRYMVATGQKLLEVQSKIASELVGVPEELDKSVSFDTNRFAENIRTLFQDVQRGLEVRIARIIGDLGGTLTCEGMIRMRK
ncbi:Ribonuclease P protein subunit P38-related [Euphorbia peplus]|nr:Ribonuclease P protein subunit P38-related [Euphorbia peplus]